MPRILDTIRDREVKAGTILIIEHGEYSDRGWTGPFKVLKDFNRDTIAAEYRKHIKNKPNNDHQSLDNFIPWLLKKKYIEDAGLSTSWHIGTYGSFDPS